MSPSTSAQQREHFISLLKRFETVMLVTLNSDHEFHGRPMMVADVEGDGRMWFITSTDTAKVHEIEMDSHVYVTAQDGDSAFLTLSGRASLVDDHDKLTSLWRESFRTWFPIGKEDPFIELISMRPERGEFWDSTAGSRAKYFWEAAKAFVSGSAPEGEDEDQHAEVKF
jgi:general stress protein 26